MATLGLWWWIDRWRKSTAYTDMSLEEQGAYRNLLDEATLRGGALPNDEKILAKACGDALRWRRVREAVLARFPVGDDGMRRNSTLDEVLHQGERRRRNQQNYRDRIAANAAAHAPDNAGAHKPANKAAYPDPDPDQEPDPTTLQQQLGTTSRASWLLSDFVPVPPEFLAERANPGVISEADIAAWCYAVRDAFAGCPVDASRPWDFWKGAWRQAITPPTAADRAAFDQWRRAMGPNASGVSIDDFLNRRKRADGLPVIPRFDVFTRKDRTA